VSDVQDEGAPFSRGVRDGGEKGVEVSTIFLISPMEEISVKTELEKTSHYINRDLIAVAQCGPPRSNP